MVEVDDRPVHAQTRDRRELHDQLHPEAERRAEGEREDPEPAEQHHDRDDGGDVDGDAAERGCMKAMVRVEHGARDAGEARRDDARHQPARHVDRDAHLRRWEAVRDERHEIGREVPAQGCEDPERDQQQVRDRAREPRRLLVRAVGEIFRERRDERAHERAVEDAEQNRRDRRGGQERVHLPLRPEELRVDDFAQEAEQHGAEGRRHDEECRRCNRAVRRRRIDDAKSGPNARPRLGSRRGSCARGSPGRPTASTCRRSGCRAPSTRRSRRCCGR